MFEASKPVYGEVSSQQSNQRNSFKTLSGHVTPLLKTPQQLPISLRVRILARAPRFPGAFTFPQFPPGPQLHLPSTLLTLTGLLAAPGPGWASSCLGLCSLSLERCPGYLLGSTHSPPSRLGSDASFSPKLTLPYSPCSFPHSSSPYYALLFFKTTYIYFGKKTSNLKES